MGGDKGRVAIHCTPPRRQGHLVALGSLRWSALRERTDIAIVQHLPLSARIERGRVLTSEFDGDNSNRVRTVTLQILRCTGIKRADGLLPAVGILDRNGVAVRVCEACQRGQRSHQRDLADCPCACTPQEMCTTARKHDTQQDHHGYAHGRCRHIRSSRHSADELGICNRREWPHQRRQATDDLKQSARHHGQALPPHQRGALPATHCLAQKRFGSKSTGPRTRSATLWLQARGRR